MKRLLLIALVAVLLAAQSDAQTLPLLGVGPGAAGGGAPVTFFYLINAGGDHFLIDAGGDKFKRQ